MRLHYASKNDLVWNDKFHLLYDRIFEIMLRYGVQTYETDECDFICKRSEVQSMVEELKELDPKTVMIDAPGLGELLTAGDLIEFFDRAVKESDQTNEDIYFYWF